jgi:hypothetical protein
LRNHQPSRLTPLPACRRIIDSILLKKSALFTAILLAASLTASAQLAPLEAAPAPRQALFHTGAAPSIAPAAPVAALVIPDSSSSAPSSLDSPAAPLEDASLAPDAAALGVLGLDAPALDAPTPAPKPRKHTPESEIAVEGLVSYGNWQIFAAGIHEALYTAGFEYDRHSWGQFIGAQMDYAADFMPLVLLKEPRTLNQYGVRRSRPGDNIIIPGIAFSPIGLRMQWRHTKKFKPYMTVLGGAIGFTQKALSPDASYYDFTLHETIGFYYKMTEKLDMRVGLFGDFHFSNAYITSYNPGLDVMNSNLALSYHFGGGQPQTP